MHNLILIRKYEKSDEIKLNSIVKDYVMSKAKDAFWFCLFREITIQLIVLLSAILFIFFGIPLTFCVLTLPAVIIFMYLSVQVSYFNKAIELTNEPYKVSWVAEIYEPQVLRQSKIDMEYGRIEVHNLEAIPDLKKMRNDVVGTVSLKSHQSMENAGWVFRLAVNPEYNFTKITEYLMENVIKHAKDEGFMEIETVTPECHEEGREVLLRLGFSIKQVYHKHLFGGVFKYMKSQLGYEYEENKINYYENFIKIT